MEVSMHEAKTSLSKLVARALSGEEIVLTHGKARTPIARIVPIQEPAKLTERPIGLFAEQMGPDSGYNWLEPMSDEELALWEAPLVSTWKANGDLETDATPPPVSASETAA
jgi:antitoxin (DNA-binding transcriptional repressor) of toxin-antitoxin stability system